MLRLELLETGRIGSSRNNLYLRGVTEVVQRYVAARATLSDLQKREMLEGLMWRLGLWLTSKPPTGTVTNTARWDGLQKIAEAVGEEMEAAGMRQLTGPANWRGIKSNVRSYWLEYLDPFHRPGFVLSPKYEQWRTGTDTRDFFTSIGAPAFWDRKVKYYGETPKAAKRIVRFESDLKLHMTHPANSGVYHTQTLSTVPSGAGWAIFVVDLDKTIYSHHHVEGIYHHSTFLSGKPVAAAGEIVVDQGDIRVITCKSGHYRPTLQNMVDFVVSFPQIPGNAIIRPEWTNPPKFYRIRQFRFEGTNAPPCKRQTVLNTIPAWAKVKPQLVAELNTIPA